MAGPRRGVRRVLRPRHAAPAFVALAAAAGIALALPGGQRLTPAPVQPAGGDAVAGSAAAPVLSPNASVPIPPSPAGPVAVAAGVNATAALPSDALPPVTSTASAAPGSTSPSPGADFPASLGPGQSGFPALPSNPSRRRAQTWEPPADPSTLDGYVWPLPHARITDPFGPSPWGSRIVGGQLFHDGLDLATFCGDRIAAAHAGIVLAAGRSFDAQIGWIGDLGPYEQRLDQQHLRGTLPVTIVIDDGNGYRSIYAHFYRVVVSVGQHVRAGQFLGYEGATGRATGCHLHYGLFSPHETATFAIEPSVVRRMLVPPVEIARINPLLVLPPRGGATPSLPTPGSGSGHGLPD
jgi:murein DD-endopeptidase MepM/ murein hydrolase activator NlpD